MGRNGAACMSDKQTADGQGQEVKDDGELFHPNIDHIDVSIDSDWYNAIRAIL